MVVPCNRKHNMKTMNCFILHAMKECAEHVILTKYGVTEEGTEKHNEKMQTIQDIRQCVDTYQVSEIFRCLEIAEPEFIKRLVKMLSGSNN